MPLRVHAASRLNAMQIKMGENMHPDEVNSIRELCAELIANHYSRKFASFSGLDFVLTGMNDARFICALSTETGPEGIRAFIKVLPKEKIGICQFVNGIWASPDLRGKGIGVLLYYAALGALGPLQSDPDSIGIMDVKTWRKLSQRLEVKFFIRQGQVYVERPLHWGPNSVPILDGRPITQTRTKFLFYTKGPQ